jgi:hypothetical protein
MLWLLVMHKMSMTRRPWNVRKLVRKRLRKLRTDLPVQMRRSLFD